MSATETKVMHTPGPWRVERTEAGEVESPNASPFTIRADLGAIPYGLMGDYKGNIVAEVQQNPVDSMDGMTKANARLIAAAPDLLTVVKKLRHVIYELKRLDPVDSDYCSICEQADMAIKKAEGRS